MDWQPLETAPKGEIVQLLYDFPAGARAVEGIYRHGTFWGKRVEGWWGGPEEHDEHGRRKPSGMWIDGWIKGWMPLAAAP